IAPNDAEPVEFSDPTLLVPNAKAIAAAPGHAETLVQEAAEDARMADEAKSAAATAARAAAPLAASLRKLEWRETRADAERAFAEKALAAAHGNHAKAESLKQKAAAKAADLGTQLNAAKADAKAKLDAATAGDAAAAAREATRLTGSVHKLELLKAR